MRDYEHIGRCVAKHDGDVVDAVWRYLPILADRRLTRTEAAIWFLTALAESAEGEVFTMPEVCDIDED